MKRITAYWLKRQGACSGQVEIVRREWPEGVPVTMAALRKALKLGLDAEWLLDFGPVSARAAYEKVRAAAQAAYEKVRAPALAAYEKAEVRALAAHDKAVAPALLAAIKSIAVDGE